MALQQPDDALDVMDPNELTVPGYYHATDPELAGAPINLDSLRDGPPGSKPFYPYSTLIRYAIKGSPNGKLLLEDIYYAIESRFPYFRTAAPGWKNSVRHNLSLNPCFIKVARPLTDRGKGSYWTVDDNVDPRTGVHRIRKRTKGKASSSKEADDDDGEGYGEGSSNSMVMPASGDGMVVEMDENGEYIWRNIWYNELIRLRIWTAEQEKHGVDQDWYRIILFRVRTALAHLVPAVDPATGLPLVLPEEQVE
ncbi:hypothetical protein EXIGLDRAFT_797815 [Exidia glandulosa HHB12029]|uniref:Fork-head domain-containing protein n=1 Tax=Exidia glandulosa HHB12029 TaxID=1314781 RepID=A0A165N5G3_EXIGL|nr:hypothetical protein EXIGLDRAFT_797815 [Exidia glandulosa HHB12029]